MGTRAGFRYNDKNRFIDVPSTRSVWSPGKKKLVLELFKLVAYTALLLGLVLFLNKLDERKEKRCTDNCNQSHLFETKGKCLAFCIGAAR